MEIIVDNTMIDPYFKEGYKHAHYHEATNEYHHASFHIDGYFRNPDCENNVSEHNPYFARLIDTMRPGETLRFKDWRRDNFIPENKTPCFKVLNILKKGIRSEDWKIDFSKSIVSRKVKEGESLEDYTMNKYPIFNSIENWLYSYGIKKILTDPNGLIVILPRQYGWAVTDYIQPFTYCVESKNILDYHAGEFVVYESDRKSTYISEGKTYTNGRILVILTRNDIYEAIQVDTRNNYQVELKYKHNIGILPALSLGGYIKKYTAEYPLYESFLAPILPGLDKAAREMSDLDAEVIQHIFSTMWRVDGQDCGTCSGVGKIPSKEGSIITCPTCDGDGNFRKSPEKEIVIKQSALNPGSNTPIPPAGYIQKQTDIVKLQDERIKAKIINALSAIGMDYLVGSLNQSGISKQYDREEANNFVFGFYYHVVENIILPALNIINEYRYTVTVPSLKDRKLMLPKIPVPEKFDIFSEGMAMARIKEARESKASSVIIDEMEMDLMSKIFYNSPESRDKLMTIKQLDPLPGINVQEKADMLLVRSVPLEDVILSNYIASFTDRALEEHEGFLKLDRAGKMKIFNLYVQEKIKSIAPVSDPPPTE